MYPIMLNLVDKKVVIIGGGKVAARKIKQLVKAKAKITVISPTLNEAIDQSEITWLQKNYEATDLKEAVLIFACTNSFAVNEQIMKDALPTQFVNNTGNKQNSDFYNVAFIEKDTFAISISTNGQSPEHAKAIKQKINQYLDQVL